MTGERREGAVAAGGARAAGAGAGAGAGARAAGAAAGRDVVGVMDVGGSHVTAALVGPGEGGSGLSVRARAEGALDAGAGRRDLLAALAAPARDLIGLDLGGGAAPLRWVVALPGPFDYAGGTGTFEGVGKFQALAGIDLGGALTEAIGSGDPGGPVRAGGPGDAGGGGGPVGGGASGSRVVFVNDAVAYGIGEWAEGPVGRPDRMLCITLGTGVGSAFLDRGRAVTTGPTVPRDGGVHTVTIDGRPLEDTMSTRAIVGRYVELARVVPAASASASAPGGVESVRVVAEAPADVSPTVEGICAAARGGDAVAQGVLDEALSALGVALAPWIDRFEASHLVVGGSISRSWDVIEGPLRQGLEGVNPSFAGRLTVVPSRLRDDAPLLGAATSWWRGDLR